MQDSACVPLVKYEYGRFHTNTNIHMPAIGIFILKSFQRTYTEKHTDTSEILGSISNCYFFAAFHAPSGMLHTAVLRGFMSEQLQTITDSERHAGKWRLLLCATLLGCLYAGVRPEPLPQFFLHFDLVVHFCACMAITYISVFAFRPPWRRYMMAGLLLAAVVLELAQGAFLAHRSASLTDFFAGISGILPGWLLARWVRRQLRSWCKEKNWRTQRTRNHW